MAGVAYTRVGTSASTSPCYTLSRSASTTTVFAPAPFYIIHRKAVQHSSQDHERRHETSLYSWGSCTPASGCGQSRDALAPGQRAICRLTFYTASQSVLSPFFQKFYFRGLKLVIKHRRRAQAIQARVKAGGEPLSRWESRFIQTNKSDLARYLTPQRQVLFVILFLTFPELRLVPFVAIMLVLEEVIPLIVLYAPGMLPSTCVLASQRERIEAKHYEKQHAYAEEMRDALLEVRKVGATALVSSLPSINSGVGLCGQVNFDSVMN
jgi:hypothetical protein